jgi:uncharacterized membrane protein YtjA (UPF0391 family)
MAEYASDTSAASTAPKMSSQQNTTVEESKMLRYALIFFVIALVAAMFGFGGVAGMSADIGKTLLTLFVVLLVVGLLFGGRLFSRA